MIKFLLRFYLLTPIESKPIRSSGTLATAYTITAQFTAHTTFMKTEYLSYLSIAQSLAFK